MVTAAMKLKEEKLWQTSHIKKQRHYFTDKEGWASKNWCFWTAVLEKTLESPLDYKENRSVNPKGNQSWIFIRRTDAEAETPILLSPDAKSLLIRKDPDAGKVEGRRRRGRQRTKWMASLTQWTWVWASSRRRWRTGEPGMLQSMGSQRVGQDWALNNKSTVLGTEQVFHNYSVKDPWPWIWWAESWELSFHLFPPGSELSFSGLLQFMFQSQAASKWHHSAIQIEEKKLHRECFKYYR